MERGSLVYHNAHGNLVFKVVSPSSLNGFEAMICEAFLPYSMKFVILTDKPENFRLR